MKILAICGSIRAESSNLAILRAAKRLVQASIEITIYEGLAELPYFNPDLDSEGTMPPPAVTRLRRDLHASDALLVSSPEYAHGIPGVLKNALDWLVSSPEMIGLPVGLISGAASEGHFAQNSLIEILTTMSAQVIRPALLNIPGVRTQFDQHGKITDPAVSAQIQSAVWALAEAAQSAQKAPGFEPL